MEQFLNSVKKAQDNEKSRLDFYESMKKDYSSTGALEMLNYLIDDTKSHLDFLYKVEENILSDEDVGFVEENDLVVKEIDQQYYDENVEDAEAELELIQEASDKENSDIEMYDGFLKKLHDSYQKMIFDEIIKSKKNHVTILMEKKNALEKFLDK